MYNLFNNILPGKGLIVLIITLMITFLSFYLIDFKDWYTIFSILYVGLIFIIRGVEGYLIGSTYKIKVWLIILVPLFIVLIIIPFIVPSNYFIYLSYFTLLWIIFNAIIASIRWVKIFEGSPVLGKPIISIALFFIFTSTILFVSKNKTENVFYYIVFPIGFIIGFISNKSKINSKEEVGFNNNA